MFVFRNSAGKTKIDKTARVIKSSLAPGCIIYRYARVKDSSLLEYSSAGDFSRVDDSSISSNVVIGRLNGVYGSKIGKHTYTGQNTIILHSEIGAFCSISWNVSIGGANHDYMRLTSHRFLYSPEDALFDGAPAYDRYEENCKIGSDVWIGCNAVILRGVEIGDGAVIAAGALVNRDIPPYSIAAGVPAKTPGKRFDGETIEKLLELKWWELPDDIIKENIGLFKTSPDENTLNELFKLKLALK